MLKSLDYYDYEFRNFIDKNLHDCKFDFYQHNLNKVTYIRDKLSNINKEINDNNYNEVFEIKKYFNNKLSDALSNINEYITLVKVA